MATYVFDLDGTICTQERSGRYQLAQPIPAMIERVQKLYDRNERVVIYTARGMNTFHGDVKKIEEEYRDLTIKWLSTHKVPYDSLIFGKPPGDFYIDDKGVSAGDFSTRDV